MLAKGWCWLLGHGWLSVDPTDPKADIICIACRKKRHRGRVCKDDPCTCRGPVCLNVLKEILKKQSNGTTMQTDLCVQCKSELKEYEARCADHTCGDFCIISVLICLNTLCPAYRLFQTGK